MSPPSASISRTRCPFAVPPIAGLHGMCATVSRDNVQSPTRAPSRAATKAASHPAWPAPITMTSKRSFIARHSFTDAEAREDVRQHVFGDALSGNLLQRVTGDLEIDQKKFLGERAAAIDK